MSNIAIIGATSFLAKSIIQQLVSQEKHFIGFDQQSYSFPEKSFSSEFPLADLLEMNVIYYCAGLGIQPKNKDPENLIYELNAFEPIRLISYLLNFGFKGKIVTFGSYFEYGDATNPTPFSEAQLVKNTNPKPNTYCHSKALLTAFVQDQINSRHDQLLHFILPNIYGAGENEHRLFPYIAKSVKNGKTMTFTAGTQLRQFVHVDDVTTLVTSQVLQNHSGIYQLGTNAQTVREAIEEALAGLTAVKENVRFEFTAMERKDTSMEYLVMDDSKARHTFGWNPKKKIGMEILKYT
ncbi:hypothetical protein BGP76_08775 [Reichenbachiella sp. MSK19-1]|nr:hypothetical protein BGP76_08775 [Reichenbachiella sp. MSK19-1]